MWPTARKCEMSSKLQLSVPGGLNTAGAGAAYAAPDGAAVRMALHLTRRQRGSSCDF